MDQDCAKIYAVSHLEAANNEDALIKLADLLLKGGITKDSFSNALLEREKIFPTGLELDGDVNVALAHADTIHVNSTGFAIGVLNKPVIFKNMGDPTINVEVKVIFVMAAANSKVVISSLQKLTEDVFQRPDVMKRIVESKTDSQLKECIESLIF